MKEIDFIFNLILMTIFVLIQILNQTKIAIL